MNKRSLNISEGKSSKVTIFKAIAVLLPFFLLILLETVLRLFGYGYDLRLFIEDEKNKSSWIMNPDASKRYFTEKENATIGTFESFRKRKSAETFRIFVLGESTTIGYPYMYNASFHRWLFYRLMHTFPDRDFEIVNLSLTAVNSYTVLGFAKELVNYQPDAVLIYCGQNEYYGTLGVGSTSQLGSNPFVIQSLLYLRSFRLVQLMGNSYSGIKGLLKGRQVDTRQTLMKRMASKQEIPLNSPVYNRGVAQFQENMEAVCKVLSGKNIPVFISNLVSNEKDLKPFISSSVDSSASADAHYSLATQAYQSGDFVKAKQQYVQAKDLDLLRFRAPEAMNAIIGDLSNKFPAVYLVDTRKIFETHSPHGIIGNETILEHVHPNIFGYSLMSEAFYQSIKKHKLISATWENEIPIEKLQKEMPITIVDSLKGTYEIAVLKENWPFNGKKTFNSNQLNSYEEKMAFALLNGKISWNTAIQNQMSHYLSQNDQVNATKVAEAAALQYPNDATFLSYAGKFCMKLQKDDKAKVYFQHAFRLAANFETAQYLTMLYFKSDQPDRALNYLNYLELNKNPRTNYSLAKTLTIEIIDCKTKLKGDSTNLSLLNKIAFNYYKMQNAGTALQYAEKSFNLDNRNKTTIELLRKIKSEPLKVP
jgi:tetratricopeptide (TPR) repeat protein